MLLIDDDESSFFEKGGYLQWCDLEKGLEMKLILRDGGEFFSVTYILHFFSFYLAYIY